MSKCCVSSLCKTMGSKEKVEHSMRPRSPISSMRSVRSEAQKHHEPLPVKPEAKRNVALTVSSAA